MLIAEVRSALTPNQAAALLTLLGLLCIGSALVQDLVTLKSARSGLENELGDLDRYRDSLSVEDVEDLKKMGAVAAAGDDLCRARVTSWIAYGLAAIAAIGLAVHLAEWERSSVSAPQLTVSSTHPQQPESDPASPSTTPRATEPAK